MASAKRRLAETQVTLFAEAVSASEAVLARPFYEVQRLASNDNEVYRTYYELIAEDWRVPDRKKWDILRRIADDAVFPGYAAHVRFAALSLNDTGLENYGECYIFLKDELIAHRASIFEENCATWVRRKKVVRDWLQLPKGSRSTWHDRSKIAVAKLGKNINGDTSPEEFPALLMKLGKSTEDDDSIEVHIWGPFTRRAFRKIVINGGKRSIRGHFEEQVAVKLSNVGTEVEFR